MAKHKLVTLLMTVLVLFNLAIPQAHGEEPANDDAAVKAAMNHDLSDFDLIAENALAKLYVNQKTLGIKIEDKKNRYIWSSTLDNIKNQRLNNSWQKFVSNALTVNYLTRDDKVKRETLEDGAKIKVTKQKDGFTGGITFRSKIRLNLEVKLIGNQIQVSIPEEKIKETENARLLNVNVYPFLGATKQDQIPGYMLIPDGAGALINYQDTSVKMTNPYQGDIYGKDPSIATEITSEKTIPPYSVTVPVYGVAHGVNQAAMLAEIASAEEYTTITAYKAGLATDFNWITAMFNYRYGYRQPTSSNDTNGLKLYQKERNPLSIVINYTFLAGEEANYIGMAKKYQEKLVKENVLSQSKENSELLRIDFLGAESKKGLLSNQLVPMTTLEQVEKNRQELAKKGVTNSLVGYTGWTKGGLGKSFGNKFPTEKQLGSPEAYQNLATSLLKQGGGFSLNTNYGLINQTINGTKDARFAQQLSGQEIKITSMDQSYGVLAPVGLLNQIKADLKNYHQLGIKQVNLSGIGQVLYSDYNKEHSVNRKAAKEVQIEALSSLQKEKIEVGLSAPNRYVWQQMNRYLDMPLSSSNYTFVSEIVPFLPIILKGYQQFYAPYTNFSANTEEEFLKMIDYGAFPSFMLTQEEPGKLSETASRNVYSTQFTQWEKIIPEYYQAMAKISKVIQDSTINQREQLPNEVVKISYSNQTTVYVNYGYEEQTVAGLNIPARSYYLEKGESE